MRAIIIEDEPLSVAELRTTLAEVAPQIEVVATASSVAEAAAVIAGVGHDLIFMDIDLPGINGMEAAQILRGYDEQTPLVFVTNLAQYAIKGYQVDALDFMVKPVAYDDFSLRMDRAMRMVRRTSKGTVAIPTPDGIRVVRLDDVLYVDIVKHDLHYHLAGEPNPLRVRGTITKVAEELAEKGFLKIAASCVINMAQVARIRATSVVMSDGTELFFSRSQRKAALERLTAYVGRSA